MEVQFTQMPLMIPAPAVRIPVGVRNRTVGHPTIAQGLPTLGVVAPTGDLIGVGVDTHRRPSLE